MNPLHWKREHLIALMISASLGAVIGLLFGIREVDPYTHYGYHAFFTVEAQGYNFYWLVVSVWAIFGASICAAVVYIRQLLRA